VGWDRRKDRIQPGRELAEPNTVISYRERDVARGEGTGGWSKKRRTKKDSYGLYTMELVLKKGFNVVNLNGRKKGQQL